MVFAIDEQWRKTWFLRLRRFAFSQRNWLEIDQAIDAIDESINPIDEKLNPKRCKESCWRKTLDDETCTDSRGIGTFQRNEEAGN